MNAKVFVPLVALMAGCTMLDRPSPSQPPKPTAQITPVTELTHGVDDADYQLGRYYQGRNMREQAIVAYQRALASNPNNAEAHNGLGVMYASLQRYDESEAEFTAAIALTPKAVHLHNNLGYCYLLQGRNEEALARFKDALALEPGNRRLQENIALAEAARKDKRTTTAPGPGVPIPPAPPSTGTPTAAPAAAMTKIEQRGGLVQVAPNIYELPAGPSRHAAAPVLPLAQAMTQPVAQPVALRELEIANGNGVTGMARRTARYFANHQVQARTRLTNIKPYRQAVTEIQYRPGLEQEARALDRMMFKPARLVASSELRPNVGVRVVLGRDLKQRPLFADGALPVQERAFAAAGEMN